ncbi:hypothetical protein ABZ800_15125 [Streptomyces sp. NPDC047813]|uniref:hypothetical protein n=1 Tax=Streptomyces sp. NPDC047813 TaxID=3154608 RepID=UPI0033CC6C38
MIYDNHRLAEGGALAEDLFDALLVHDTWDDDGDRTMFTSRVLAREGWVEVGTVKVGHVATDGEDFGNYLPPERFSRLDSSRYFSVGRPGLPVQPSGE